MIGFDIERLVPKHILRDKNGYAMAKAIERAFEIISDAVQTGIDIIQDPEKMPEWRLDELAGELGCLYDYSGTLEKKRYWIANAVYMYTIYGTPRAIVNFLEGAFSDVIVEEHYGEPFHFSVTVADAEFSASRIAWAQKVIARVKNTRSVLDDISVDSSSNISVSAGAGVARPMIPRTAETTLTGTSGGL